MGRKYRYNDQESSGAGILRCYLCDRPIVEHPIGRCPFPSVISKQKPRAAARLKPL